MASPALAAENAGHLLQPTAVFSPAQKNKTLQTYYPVADVKPGLAQVVVYYPKGTLPATLYVDRELHSVLSPGQFTILCIAPGAHSVESYFNDYPIYHGKRNPMQKLNTESARTYFIQVNPGTSGNTSALEDRSRAEAILKGMHKQTKFVSRASQVKPCDYVAGSRNVLLQQQSGFRFATSNAVELFNESRQKIDGIQVERFAAPVGGGAKS